MSFSRYFHTVRYLRPGQLAARVAFRLRRPPPDIRPAPVPRTPVGTWSAAPGTRSAVDADYRFRLLNVERRVAAPSDWNHPGWEKLWLYNLHYFDVLRSEAIRPQLAHSLIADWIRHNPPCAGVGWEPYPASLRIVNWIKWSLSGHPLAPAALHSLAVQVRHVARRLERHLLGNHLLANAKALVFAGAFFRGPEADAWLRDALAVLEEQLAEQILPDGAHFELSPMYHSIALEDLLDLVNLDAVYALGAPRAAWTRLAGRMLGWLRAMCHPDGEIAFFNDAALGIAVPPQALEAYAASLGVRAAPECVGAVQYMENSGYIAARMGRVALIFDAAPIGPDYLPAHAHADTLSFELSWAGRRVICNSGTSRYGLGERRDWERSTAAHKTFVIDGENSSEVWHGFRVARRARPVGVVAEASDGRASFKAAHDGYARLPGHPLHEREIVVTGHQVEWTDRVSGGGRHAVAGRIPLHPQWRVRDRGGALEITHEDGPTLELVTLGAARLTIERGSYAEQFGSVVERPVVVWRLEGPLPLENRLRLCEK